MPKISQAPSSRPADPRKTFRERLTDRFAAHEWVRVINPDDEAFYWQYLPTHAEKHDFTPDPMKITYREDPEQYMLEPGESEVLLGENAYVMIEALYKKLVAKKKVAESPDIPETRARNFNWTDANLQEQWIDKIYLGREEPQFNRPKQAEKPETAAVNEPQRPSPAKKAA